MIDLRRFYINPFKDERISTSELVAYALAHLSRMTENNPGNALDGPIALTGNLLTAVDGQISNETVRLGVQKASVQAKNDFRLNLTNAMSKIHGACLGVWGKKNPKMLEVFPGGLSAFSSADDPDLDHRLDALVVALGSNSDALTTAPSIAAKALATTWAGLFGVVNTAKGKTSSAADLRKNALVGLKNQLFQNLLSLAGLFPDQEAKADLYHPQYLLENETSSEPAAPATPPVG